MPRTQSRIATSAARCVGDTEERPVSRLKGCVASTSPIWYGGGSVHAGESSRCCAKRVGAPMRTAHATAVKTLALSVPVPAVGGALPLLAGTRASEGEGGGTVAAGVALSAAMALLVHLVRARGAKAGWDRAVALTSAVESPGQWLGERRAVPWSRTWSKDMGIRF